MMPWYILFNLSIVLAAVIAAARFNAYGKALFPFLCLVWLAAANEILSLVLMYTVRDNSINSNIYTLLEFGLILLQYFFWNGGRKQLFSFLAIAGLFIWILDNLALHALRDNNSLFRICYAFTIVILSIDALNRRIIDARRPLLKDTVFLICAGFLFYFSCKAFMEVFNLFAIGYSTVFEARLFFTLSFVNCISNLLYAIALLCIPMKQQYSLPF